MIILQNPFIAYILLGIGIFSGLNPEEVPNKNKNKNKNPERPRRDCILKSQKKHGKKQNSTRKKNKNWWEGGLEMGIVSAGYLYKSKLEKEETSGRI